MTFLGRSIGDETSGIEMNSEVLVKEVCSDSSVVVDDNSTTTDSRHRSNSKRAFEKLDVRQSTPQIDRKYVPRETC